jgi:hypothetical protein
MYRQTTAKVLLFGSMLQVAKEHGWIVKAHLQQLQFISFDQD